MNFLKPFVHKQQPAPSIPEGAGLLYAVYSSGMSRMISLKGIRFSSHSCAR